MRKAGFGMGRRVSLMLATVTGAARGLSGRDLRRLLGLWVYAFSFKREALSVLNAAFVAVECFPQRRRCAVEGASLDELLVTTFLAPLLDADIRALPPSPLCDRLQSFRRWCLFDACVSAALDPSSRLRGRERLLSEVGLGYRFDAPERRLPDWWWICRGSKVSRIGFGTLSNQLSSLISLMRGPVGRGLGNRRVLCLVDSRVVLGSVCKSRSSSRRVNFRLRRLGGLLLANNLSLDLCWVPSW